VERHPLAARAELDRVADQVVEHLNDALVVDPGREGVAGDVPDDRDLALGGVGGGVRHGAAQDGGDRLTRAWSLSLPVSRRLASRMSLTHATMWSHAALEVSSDSRCPSVSGPCRPSSTMLTNSRMAVRGVFSSCESE
jgi:hypothetical protein